MPPQLQKLVVDPSLCLETRRAHVLLGVFERGGVGVGHEITHHDFHRVAERDLSNRALDK